MKDKIFKENNEDYNFEAEVKITKRCKILTPSVCSTWFRLNADNVAFLQWNMIDLFNKGIEELDKKMKYIEKK